MPELSVPSILARRRSTGSLLRLSLAILLAAWGPSVATAEIDPSEVSAWESEVEWTARWEDPWIGFDVGVEGASPRIGWTASSPLGLALRHQLTEGLRIEASAACVPDAEAWRSLVLENDAAELSNGSGSLASIDATLELVADIGGRGSGRPWRIGVGGGWSRADRILGRADDSRGFAGFLADDPGAPAVTGIEEAADEGVVWLRVSRSF